MRRSLLVVLALCASILAMTDADAAPRAFRVETIARLDFPTQMAFDPSGRLLFVNEKGGRVRLIKDGDLQNRPFTTIETDAGGEGGLLGIAVDPRFEQGERWVYLFHSSADGSKDMVTRVLAEGSRGGRREVVLDDIPAASIHHGGVIAFGPDGKLYVANGDHADADTAQDRDAFGGKVYRVDPDGSIPDDNPFKGSRTYSYGHRNMFGIDFDADGDLWVSENGDDNHDEINQVRRGGNHGWPIVEGRANDDRFVDPVIDLEQIVVPTGLAFSSGELGERYDGDLFVGAYGDSTIERVQLRGDRARRRSVFHRGEQIVALLFGEDGLYFSTPDAVKLIRPRNPVAQSRSPSPAAPTEPTGSPGGEDEPGSPAPVIWSLLGAGLVIGGALVARSVRRQKAAR